MGFPEILVPLVVMPMLCLVPVVIVFIVSRSNRHRRELLSRERLAAIEKGMTPPLDMPESNRSHRNPLRSSLITVGAGIGLAVFFASIPAEEGSPWGLGVLVALIGLGLLAHWFAGGKAEWERQRVLDEELQRAYIDRLRAGLPAKTETPAAD
jgi:hypothetical protein